MFWFFGLWGMWDLSSLTRDQTHTPCIGRWSLNHWTDREVPHLLFFWFCFVLLCVFWIFEFYFIFLNSRFLLVIYFIHISVYMSIPISQFIPPLPTPRHFPPLVSIPLFSTSVSLFLPCKPFLIVYSDFSWAYRDKILSSVHSDYFFFLSHFYTWSLDHVWLWLLVSSVKF